MPKKKAQEMGKYTWLSLIEMKQGFQLQRKKEKENWKISNRERNSTQSRVKKYIL